MDNSIGEESTTNNKFDEESITNDKIVEDSSSRARKSVDEDAVKEDEAARSAMSRRLLIQKSQSGECTERASVQTIRLSGVQELEFQCVERERSGRDQASEVSSGNTRSDLRRRQQRCVIEDANEDCQKCIRCNSLR